MARQRGRTVSVRTPSQRRKSSWGGVVSTTYTTIPAGSSVLLASITAANLLASNFSPGGTIVRVRGMLSVRSDQGASAEGAMGAFGMAVVTDQARAAGAASIPSPGTDANSDAWFVWHGLFAPPVINTNFIAMATQLVDSKAQRKLGEDDAVVFVVENLHASEGFTFGIQSRVLFLLP